MKPVFFFLLLCCCCKHIDAQTVYTFNGKGNWTIASNWSNGIIPPSILPAGSTINITPLAGDTCLLNVGQTISTGAFLNISAGAQFIIIGNLNVIGYTYPKVSICQQVWMTKNLDVSTYKNGDLIPEIRDSAQWANYTGGAWCWYNNDSASYAALYGKLYNWYAVNDPRGLAPAGWHLPTFAEWSSLINCLGYDTSAGGRMKDTMLWKSPNTGATNSSGFTARPGGSRNLGNIPHGFSDLQETGYWWSSTKNDTLQLGTYLNVSYFNRKINYNYAQPNTGLSVRVIKEPDPTAPILSTNTITSFTSTNAVAGGNISKDGGAPITSRGVCWSTNENPTTSDNKTIDSSGTGAFISNITGLLPNTLYNVRAYATNSIGTGYGAQSSFTATPTPDSTFTDPRDGQIYTCRRLGAQLWMTKNLNFVTDSSWCYDTLSSNCGIYGRLYNWNAAKIAAPPGWHLPTQEEWNRMVNFYLTGNNDFESDANLGGKLKAVNSLWDSPNSNATNSSGFSGLPGGNRLDTTSFQGILKSGYWWTADETNTLTAAFHYLIYNYGNYYDNDGSKSIGMSVRCVKNELPVVVTDSVRNLTENAGKGGGKILVDGGLAITGRGICWSEQHNPTIANSKTIDSAVNGVFISNLSALAANTTYYARAYASNSFGTGYGDELRFKTVGALPTVETDIFYYSDTTVQTGGTIVDIGASAITSYGMCWNTEPSPTTANSKTSYTGIVPNGTFFFKEIKNLFPETDYYFRAYATNDQGISYGNEVKFSKSRSFVKISSDGANATSSTASIGFHILNNFEGRLITANGVCWGLTPNPTIENNVIYEGSGPGSFLATISGLTPNTIYYARAFAKSGDTIYYGQLHNFTTLKQVVVPVVNTSPGFTSLTKTSLIAEGTVVSDNGRMITARGFCWNTQNGLNLNNSPKSIESGGLGKFTSNITGLQPATYYWVRAYATNSAGTSYGEEQRIFTLSELPTLNTDFSVVSVNPTSATSGGEILYSGDYPVIARGVCWSTAGLPTINDSKTVNGNGNGAFNSTLTGLIPGTTYFVRAYATNSAGTRYGNEITFVPLPIVAASAPYSITKTSAGLSGEITVSRGNSVTSGGFCWNTESLPTINNSKTNNGSGTGSFNGTLTNLLPNTTYYVRAYAINNAGTGYSSQQIFTTLPPLPVLTTYDVYSATQTSVASGGNISDSGGRTVVARGVCWSTTASPTVSNSKTLNGNGVGFFPSTVTGLTPNTNYYLRAYATNSAGTGYGQEVSFKTLSQYPVLTTASVSSITEFSAASGGNISSDGGLPILQRGVCWSTTPDPTTTGNKTSDAQGVGSFAANLTGLTKGTGYFVRAYATNSLGTSYGNEVYFKTLSRNQPAVIVTDTINILSFNSASAKSNITDSGGSVITAKGICWGTLIDPTIANSKTVDGAGSGNFVSALLPLLANTVYYFRAYATNTFGTAYGNIQSFKTPEGDSSFTDPRDGQKYSFKRIGNQVWMTQNLNYAVPSSWCYGNSSGNCGIYGQLYTRVTALTVAPPGWHLPSDDEWTTLVNTLGGNSVAGGKMKAKILWNDPNTGADNSSGFAAYPGGYGFTSSAGGFYDNGKKAAWWSNTPNLNGYDGNYVLLENNSTKCGLYNIYPTYGLSVRCIRN